MSRAPRMEPVAGLVFDATLYPRHDIDPQHVNALLEAFEADAPLPPLVACKDTRKLVDGVHRWHALVRRFADRAEWYVKWESYADDRERLMRAVALNAQHGLRLSKYDRAHVQVIARRLEIPDAELAAAFGVRPPAFTASTEDRFARVEGGGHRLASRPCERPLKRTIRHMAGKVLTPQQVQTNEKLSGWSPRFHADQIIELIDADLIDREDRQTLERLACLREKLTEFLPAAVSG